MLRFVFNAIAVVLIGLALGYLMWGSRVGNLTQALNNMILEEDALRARLAATSASAAVVRIGEDGEAIDPALAGEAGAPSGILATLDALKSEVQFQAKLIEQQSLLLQQLADGNGGPGNPSMAACGEDSQNLTSQLQRCMIENGDLRTRLGAAPAQGWPSPNPDSSGRPPGGQIPRY